MPSIKTKDFTAEEIGRIAKVLAGYSGELAKFAEDMKAEEIAQLAIKGVGELERAEYRIGIFCDNTRTAFRRATRPKLFEEDALGEKTTRSPRPTKKRSKKTK